MLKNLKSFVQFSVDIPLHTLFLQLHTLFLQLHTIFLQLRTAFLQLHTLFLQLHTLFLQLHTQLLPTTPLQQKNDRYPPKGRATIAHQSINVCTKIFLMNSGKNNCFSSAFAISGMRRPNENISPVAKRYVRFGSSGTPSNSTSSTL